MTKYQQYYQLMLKQNEAVFKEFEQVHDNFAHDQQTYRQQFNEIGAKVNDLIIEYENRLCAQTERGMYSSFSGGLADKFRAEVKKHFPLIDFIGAH